MPRARARHKAKKGPGLRSPARARAARKNGAKGGRPRSVLSPEDVQLIGDAPLGKPLALARWFTDTIALLTQRCLEGCPYRELLDLVRNAAAASGKVLPHDIIFEAHKRLKDDEKDVAATSTGARQVQRGDDEIAARAVPSRRKVE